MRRAIPVRQPHPKAQRQTQGPFQTGFIKIETVSRPAARPVPSGLRRTQPCGYGGLHADMCHLRTKQARPRQGRLCPKRKRPA